MPKFESELTNKSFAGSGMREIEVPDETGHEEFDSIDFDAIDNMRADRGLPPLDVGTKRAMLASRIQSKKVEQPRPQRKFVSTEPEMSVQKLAEFEHTIATARRDKVSGIERLSAAAKRRIEALCGMSSGTKEVDIDGNKFVLRTLRGKEQRAAIVEASNFDGTPHAAFEIRKQLLARALVQVAGADVELFLGDNSIDARLALIDELEEPMLLKLYSDYLELAQETQNKYFVKTAEEAKEVIDELKK